jgi:hypothetical protein
MHFVHAKFPNSSVCQLEENPFSLGAEDAYRRWRDRKLAAYPLEPAQLMVEIADPTALTRAEQGTITALCCKTNMAFYTCARVPSHPKEALSTLARQFGLHRLDRNLCADEDGIAAIQVVPKGRSQEYIPYTDRPIRWHTDGYYNLPEEQIRGLAMHCVQPAASGGENQLLDPEIVYILMREENPEYVAALMEEDAMTIPPNVEDGQELRPARQGPVFSMDAETGALHLRYTARTRSIRWKEDGRTQEAVGFLETLLKQPLSYVLRVRLASGQGILCNNVLHTREGFCDDPPAGIRRLHLRARYYDRIAGT